MSPRNDPYENLAQGRQARSNRYRLGFWAVAFAFTALMAFTTAPTPLWSLFAQRDHFSSLTVTIVFAAYAVAVAISLVLAGHLSDTMGRPLRLLVPALALNVVAGVVFVAWPALPGLLVARVLSGLGVGAATATATVWLAELDAARRRPAGSTGRRLHQHRREPRRARLRRPDSRWPRASRSATVSPSRSSRSWERCSSGCSRLSLLLKPAPRPRRDRATAPSTYPSRRVRGSILRRPDCRRDHVRDLRADHLACAQLPRRDAAPALARACGRCVIRAVRRRGADADADRSARPA